jgi:hypothetical protein
MNKTIKCYICSAVLVVLPAGEVFELMEDRRLKPHIHSEQPEAQHPVGRTVIADQASATATGGGGFPIGAFTGPDRPHLAKPHRVQNAMMNDNLSWLP